MPKMGNAYALMSTKREKTGICKRTNTCYNAIGESLASLISLLDRVRSFRVSHCVNGGTRFLSLKNFGDKIRLWECEFDRRVWKRGGA